MKAINVTLALYLLSMHLFAQGSAWRLHKLTPTSQGDFLLDTLQGDYQELRISERAAHYFDREATKNKRRSSLAAMASAALLIGSAFIETKVPQKALVGSSIGCFTLTMRFDWKFRKYTEAQKLASNGLCPDKRNQNHQLSTRPDDRKK